MRLGQALQPALQFLRQHLTVSLRQDDAPDARGPQLQLRLQLSGRGALARQGMPSPGHAHLPAPNAPRDATSRRAAPPRTTRAPCRADVHDDRGPAPRALQEWQHGEVRMAFSDPRNTALPQRLPELHAAVVACLDGTAVPATPSSPALALARDPLRALRAGDWGPLLVECGQPAWLEAWLQDETARAGHGDAAAQTNRLEALGRCLFLLTAAGLDLAEGERAENLQTLLRLPSQDLRQKLLRLWLVSQWCLDLPPERPMGNDPSLRALVLALRCQQIDVNEPHVAALLRTPALTHDGVVTRRLLSHVVNAPRVARALLQWPSQDRLLQLFTWAARQDDALGAAARWREAPTAFAAQRHHGEALSKAAACLTGASADTLRDHCRSETERLAPAWHWLAAQPGHGAAAAVHALVFAQDYPGALRGARALPRGPLRDWVVELVQQTERAARLKRGRPSAYPTAAMLEQRPMRQAFNRHVAPMLLALEQHAALIPAETFPALRHPAEVQAKALGVLPGPDVQAQWAQLQACIPEAHNLIIYAARGAHWQTYGDAGRRGLQQLFAALLSGELTAARRAAPQMRRVLESPRGAALRDAWEAEHSEVVVVEGQPWTVADSGCPGVMLDAVTRISSCQSVQRTDGFNVAMVGRMLDGSRRMLTVRDTNGRLRTRALLRLLNRGDDGPVLTVSVLYGEKDEAREALVHRYVQRRAAALGIDAASSWLSGQTLLSCMGSELPDYWDEGWGLTHEVVTELCTLLPCAAQ